ncbi:MAG: hypothetical protein ABMA64_26455 [Myxococcota bacterium]
MWLALYACTTPPPIPATEIGNPERVLGVATFDPVGDQLQRIDSAWVSLGHTKFVLDPGSEVEELEWETPTVVADLLLGAVEIEFRSPNAFYEEIRVRPQHGRDAPANAPADLKDGSFVVDGTRADGVPFHLVSRFEDDIDLFGTFELGKGQVTLALGFDVSTWLDGVNLDAANVQGGSIFIDRDHNEPQMNAFDANIADSIRLTDDLDEDGQVGEADAVLLD